MPRRWVLDGALLHISVSQLHGNNDGARPRVELQGMLRY